jgi:hypothetical protein
MGTANVCSEIDIMTDMARRSPLWPTPGNTNLSRSNAGTGVRCLGPCPRQHDACGAMPLTMAYVSPWEQPVHVDTPLANLSVYYLVCLTRYSSVEDPRTRFAVTHHCRNESFTQISTAVTEH